MARTIRTMTFAVLAASVLFVLAGCGGASQEPTVEPKVSPPAIGVKGTLRAGIDLDYPPFGGVDAGKRAGIDVDTAAALADALGLKLEIVDVTPADAAKALGAGDVDVVFSVPLDSEVLSGATIAGTYITDGPAFFASAEQTGSAETTFTISTIAKKRVVAQDGSPAYWYIQDQLGPAAVAKAKTLRDAFQQLVDGKSDLVAGDALVGAYIARDFPGVRFAGQVTPAAPLAVVVAPDNTALADPVREALDSLAADGVLDTIRRKWVDDLPELELAEETSPTP